MKAILFAALLLIAKASFAEDYYFSCVGSVGVADGQAMTPLQSRTITSAESKVTGSMRVTSDRVIIDGIPWLASDNGICENSDQVLWFNRGGLREYCSGNDVGRQLGLFNKVTGILIYHEGDSLAIFQCKKAEKLMK
jgi:hypothetical protein